MLYLALLGLFVVGVAASEQKCAQAGGPDAHRRRALKRLPPHLRAKAEANMRARARASGIGRGLAGRQPLVHAGDTRPRRAPIHCPPLPWMQEHVDEVTYALLEAGMRDPEQITLRVLADVYPVTDDGQPISWPAQPDDCAAIKAMQLRTALRVRRHLAVLADLKASEDYDG